MHNMYCIKHVVEVRVIRQIIVLFRDSLCIFQQGRTPFHNSKGIRPRLERYHLNFMTGPAWSECCNEFMRRCETQNQTQRPQNIYRYTRSEITSSFVEIEMKKFEKCANKWLKICPEQQRWWSTNWVETLNIRNSVSGKLYFSVFYSAPINFMFLICASAFIFAWNGYTCHFPRRDWVLPRRSAAE